MTNVPSNFSGELIVRGWLIKDGRIIGRFQKYIGKLDNFSAPIDMVKITEIEIVEPNGEHVVTFHKGKNSGE
jgi:hypothetical protein